MGGRAKRGVTSGLERVPSELIVLVHSLILHMHRNSIMCVKPIYPALPWSHEEGKTVTPQTAPLEHSEPS